jgi:hypothetical protein
MKLVEWYEYARSLVPEDGSHWHDWHFKTSIPPTTSIPPIILETLSEGASKPLRGRIRPATVEMLGAFCFSWYSDNFRGNWAEQTLPAVLKNWGDGWSHPDLYRGDESIPRHSVQTAIVSQISLIIVTCWRWSIWSEESTGISGRKSFSRSLCKLTVGKFFGGTHYNSCWKLTWIS